MRRTVWMIAAVMILAANVVSGEPPVKTDERAEKLYAQAVVAVHNNELPAAQEAYREILSQHPDVPFIADVKKELAAVNIAIIQSDQSTPGSKTYDVQTNDTLGKIAAAQGTTLELIRKKNHLSSDVIRPGQKLLLWAAPLNIVISKKKNILTLRMGEDTIKVYSISTGKAEKQTPTGEFTIIHRYPDPTWFHKGDVVPPGTPENFLGTRWLGFDRPGYGIHGTIFPEQIGQSVSSGCVRMRNEDVEELYDLVAIGTRVEIVP